MSGPADEGDISASRFVDRSPNAIASINIDKLLDKRLEAAPFAINSGRFCKRASVISYYSLYQL
jgi:hypothetical protein